MSTPLFSLTATPSRVFTEWLVGELLIPCDYSANQFCRQAPADWSIAVACPACGFGGLRLAGTDCKDLFLDTEDLIECPSCDAVRQPKDFIKWVEAL